MSVATEKAKFRLANIPGKGLGLSIPNTIQKARVKFKFERNDNFEPCRLNLESNTKFIFNSNRQLMIKVSQGVDYDKINKITIKGENVEDNVNEYGIALKNYGSSAAGFNSTLNGKNSEETDIFVLKRNTENYIIQELLGRDSNDNEIDYNEYLRKGSTSNWDGRNLPRIIDRGQKVNFYDENGSDVNGRLSFKNKELYFDKEPSVTKVSVKKRNGDLITRTASDTQVKEFTLTVNSNDKTFYEISYDSFKSHNVDTSAKTHGEIYWTSNCPSSDNKDGRLFIVEITDVELIGDTPLAPPPDDPLEPEPPSQPGPPVYEGPTSCPPDPWSPPYDSNIPCPSEPSIDNGGDKELILTRSGGQSAILDLKRYAGKLVTLKIEWRKTGDWAQNFSFTVPNCSDISGEDSQTPLYSSTTIDKLNASGSLNWKVYNVDGGSTITFVSTSIPGTRPSRQHYKAVVTSSTSGDPPVTTYTTTCEPDYVEYAEPWPPCSEELYITKTGYSEVSYVYCDGSNDQANSQVVVVTVLATRDVLRQNNEISFDKGLQRHIWIRATSPNDSNGEPGHSLSDYHNYTPLSRIRNPVNGTSATSLPTDGTGCGELYDHAGAMTPSRIDALIAAGITDLSSSAI